MNRPMTDTRPPYDARTSNSTSGCARTSRACSGSPGLNLPLSCAMLVTLAAAGLAGATAGELHRPHQILVSPSSEITVIDPGTSSDGRPTPEILKDAAGTLVDIPPSVVVHNYFYSGDRDFRGPVLPGGPTVVVVSHPWSNERMYLDVQMLPGSPRVIYRRTHIDYDFGGQRIRLCFHHPRDPLHKAPATVRYCHGNNRIRDAIASGPDKSHVRAWLNRTGLPTALKSTADKSKNLMNGAADRIQSVGHAVIEPASRLIKATPLGGLVDCPPEESAQSHRDAEVRAAGHGPDPDAFFPTNR